MNRFLERLVTDPRLKKYMPVFIGMMGLLMVVVFIVATQVSKTNLEPYKVDKPFATDSTGIIVNVVVQFLIVLGIMYFLFAILKWWQKRDAQDQKKRLNVIETVRLSPKQAIHIVRVGSQEYMVGATDQTLNILAELESDVMVESQPKENPILSEANHDFSGLFKKALKSPIKTVRKSEDQSVPSA